MDVRIVETKAPQKKKQHDKSHLTSSKFFQGLQAPRGQAAGVVAQNAKATPKFRAFSARRKQPMSSVTSSGATLKLSRCSIKNLGDSLEMNGI